MVDALADPARPVPNLAAADAFEFYYTQQHLVESHSEWIRFISTMHRALPVTIRVQPHGALGDECRQSLRNLLSDLALQHGAHAVPAVEALPWCSSFSIAISKEELKSSHEPARSALQAWLSKWAALGALTRQAIESMVPVALLDVQPHHACCDMCASPGSKTTQAIEAIFAHGDAAAARGGGFMVANDASPRRCQMLLRRCAALGEQTARLIISCHPAQSLPRLPTGPSAAGAPPPPPAAAAATAAAAAGAQAQVL